MKTFLTDFVRKTFTKKDNRRNFEVQGSELYIWHSIPFVRMLAPLFTGILLAGVFDNGFVEGTIFIAIFFNKVFSFCNTNAITKIADTFGRVTTAAHATDSWHSGIVPPGYMFLIHQLQELTFTHDRIGHVQTRKLVLM